MQCDTSKKGCIFCKYMQNGENTYSFLSNHGRDSAAGAVVFIGEVRYHHE